jgi:hypothetical protein
MDGKTNIKVLAELELLVTARWYRMIQSIKAIEVILLPTKTGENKKWAMSKNQKK